MSESRANGPTLVRRVRVADLVALADGSLPPRHRAAVLAEVHRSAALTAALSEQQRVASLIRSTDIRAPATPHRKVQALLEERRRGHRRTPTASRAQGSPPQRHRCARC
jgi:hypothetical protein